MEPKKAYKVFRYQTNVLWKSGRRAVIFSAGKPAIEVSSPPEFRGEAGFWTPEDMFVASVNLCTLTTFLAYAQHKGLELVGYESAAEGVLENVEGKYRFTEVVLHPHVTVRSQEDIARARELMESAHKGCLVSNSLTTAVKVLPDFRVA
jgi:organic hydroperoxide reductase OsmC/OhrA